MADQGSPKDELIKLLQDPMELPIEFKTWLGKYLELNPPNLPINEMLGYKATPKITTGPLSSGPPASPEDGDIWIATGVDGNGTRWQFQYNAGSASAYKWEFIGGPEVINVSPTGNGWAADAYNNIGNGYTTVRAGDYLCSCSVSGLNTSSTRSFQIGVGVGSTTSVNRVIAIATWSASWDYSLAGFDRVNGVGAGVVLWLNGYSYSIGSAAPGETQFTIKPVRIS